MAVLFFVKKCWDGNGDIVHAVKIADFVENLFASKEIKEDILIVVPDEIQHKNAVHLYLNNPRITVKTLSELQSNMPQINCCIEVSYDASFWQKKLGAMVKKEKIPCIYMPEYGDIPSAYGKKTINTYYILGGFDKEKGHSGVIPSKKLLDATAKNSSRTHVIEDSFEALDPKIKRHFNLEGASYLKYRDSHDFSYQYSHDMNTYRTYKDPGTNVTETIQDSTPATFFFREHLTLSSQKNSSQDVLCIGNSEGAKKGALLKIKDNLIQNGYSKIVFINTDTNHEELLHHDTSLPSKEYRVLYSAKVPFTTMQVLPLLTNDLVGVTGDQSLIEAMSAGNLVTYECRAHKVQFARSYISAVKQETSNKKVHLLAKYLIKPTINSCFEYNEEELQKLLKDQPVVDELKRINRKLIADSTYLESAANVILNSLKNKPLLKNYSSKKEKAVPISPTPNLVPTPKKEPTWIRVVTHPSSILLVSGAMAGVGAVIGAIFFGPIGALAGAAVFFLPILIGMAMFRLGMKRKYSNYKPPKPTTNRTQNTELGRKQLTSFHANKFLPTLGGEAFQKNSNSENKKVSSGSKTSKNTKTREKNNNQTQFGYKTFNPSRSNKEKRKQSNTDNNAYKKN